MFNGRVSPIRLSLIVITAAALTILAYRSALKNLAGDPKVPASMTMEEACAAESGQIVGLDALHGETVEGVLYEVRLALCASKSATMFTERLVAKRPEIESLLAPGEAATLDDIYGLYDRRDLLAERLDISSRRLELRMDFDYSKLPEARRLELWGRQLTH